MSAAPYTGRDLIAAGIKPGKWFPQAIAAANAALSAGADHQAAIAAELDVEPKKSGSTIEPRIQTQNTAEAPFGPRR